MDTTKREIIRKEIEPKLDEIKSEFESVFDPDTMEEIIRVSRDIGCLSPDDLLRPFTI